MSFCAWQIVQNKLPHVYGINTRETKYNEPNIILFTTNKFEAVGLLPSLPLDCNCEGNSNLQPNVTKNNVA